MCPEMVVVPAGNFSMGSEASSDETPVHEVALARPFAVGKFEVTFAEWDACVADGACSHVPDDQGFGRQSRPVIDVSWNDVTGAYLPWLSRKAGRTYRLLSEAEWEYAARAGSRAVYTWGDEIGSRSRQLRPLRQRLGQPADGAGRLVRRQRVRPARSARQRLGVDAGLLPGQLCRRAQEWSGAAACQLPDASRARRRLERPPALSALGHPLWRSARLSRQLRRLPRGARQVTYAFSMRAAIGAK